MSQLEFSVGHFLQDHGLDHGLLVSKSCLNFFHQNTVTLSEAYLQSRKPEVAVHPVLQLVLPFVNEFTQFTQLFVHLVNV